MYVTFFVIVNYFLPSIILKRNLAQVNVIILYIDFFKTDISCRSVVFMNKFIMASSNIKASDIKYWVLLSHMASCLVGKTKNLRQFLMFLVRIRFHCQKLGMSLFLPFWFVKTSRKFFVSLFNGWIVCI